MPRRDVTRAATRLLAANTADVVTTPAKVQSVTAFGTVGEFQAGIQDRRDQSPLQHAFTELSSYHLFTG